MSQLNPFSSYSVAAVRELLSHLEIRPRKTWGQNFLCNGNLAKELLDRVRIDPQLSVVEVGPGLGILTELLHQRLSPACGIVAVELDKKLAAYLTEKFKQHKRISIVQADILKLDLDKILQKGESFQVVSNLPYSISTEVFFYFLQYRRRIPQMALMVQKEVAQRLLAKPGTEAYGRLSVLPQIYFEISEVRRISGGHFFPSVAVDSSFLWFRRRELPLIAELEDADFSKTFKQLLAAIFSSRRKNLKNSLKRLGTFSNETLEAILRAVEMPAQTRGENLAPTELRRLTQAILDRQRKDF